MTDEPNPSTLGRKPSSMTTRKMTEKGFLHKASGKVSALAFLSQHKEWLQTGELASLTSPILSNLEEGVAHPTETLSKIKEAVLSHLMAKEIRAAEASLQNQETPSAKGWLASILDGEGEIQVQKDFEKASDADRWVDRQLFDGFSDWHATVTHAVLKVATATTRTQAMSRILKEKKSPVMHQNKSSASLSFGVKSKPSHCHFSKG